VPPHGKENLRYAPQMLGRRPHHRGGPFLRQAAGLLITLHLRAGVGTVKKTV
jgi:hypothetical protein